MVMTPQQILERENKKKQLEEEMLAVAKQRKSDTKFNEFKGRQNAIKEESQRTRSDEYTKCRNEYARHAENFMDHSFNTTQSWMSAQIAMAQLCLKHFYKVRAWRQQYTGKLMDAVGGWMKEKAYKIGQGIAAAFEKAPAGKIDLPPITCGLKVTEAVQAVPPA